jgi:hypothetical protein
MDNLVHQDSTFMQRMSTAFRRKNGSLEQPASLSEWRNPVLNGGVNDGLFAAELSDRRNNHAYPTIFPSRRLWPPSVFATFTFWAASIKDAQVTVGPVGFVSAASITVDSAVIGVGGITIKGAHHDRS